MAGLFRESLDTALWLHDATGDGSGSAVTVTPIARPFGSATSIHALPSSPQARGL